MADLKYNNPKLKYLGFNEYKQEGQINYSWILKGITDDVYVMGSIVKENDKYIILICDDKDVIASWCLVDDEKEYDTFEEAKADIIKGINDIDSLGFKMFGINSGRNTRYINQVLTILNENLSKDKKHNLIDSQYCVGGIFL